jgi:penicillin V acylase-like amidase (Ntn superfamily)
MNSKFFNNEKAVTVPMDKMTGCLSFNFINQNGKHMYGRNFDIGENTPAVATFTKTPNGYKYYSTSTYSFFTNQKNPNNSLIKKLCATASYVPLDGMNEKGLCVSMNNVSYYRNTFDGYTNQEIEGRVNMTCSLLFKYILQTCENVQEAINLINTINIHDDLQSSSMSMHFQIVDRTGSSVIVEFDHTHNSETKLVFPRTGENFQINENFTQ